MPTLPPVSVVIAAADAATTLPETLQAVAAQDYPGMLQTIVAAADPPTVEAAMAGGAEVVVNEKGTTPAGLNLAVEHSTGEILVRADAHSIIPPAYVSGVVERLQAGYGDVVGGMQVPVGTSFWERAIAGAMGSRLGAGDAQYRVGGKPGAVDTVYLGAFHRSTFQSLDGFNEAFLRNQDYEFNHRVRMRGGTVWFEPSLRVTYKPRSSLGQLGKQYFQYGRWKRFFSRTYPGTLRLRQLAPPLIVLALALGLVLSIAWPWALAAPIGYAALLAVGGVLASGDVGVAAIGTPAALAVMHISWGLGFLIGQTTEP